MELCPMSETTINVSRVAHIQDRFRDRTGHKNRTAEFKAVQLSGNTLEGGLNPSTLTGHTCLRTNGNRTSLRTTYRRAGRHL